MSVLYHNPIADVNANLEGAYRREPRNAAHLTRGVAVGTETPALRATRKRRPIWLFANSVIQLFSHSVIQLFPHSVPFCVGSQSRFRVWRQGEARRAAANVPRRTRRTRLKAERGTAAVNRAAIRLAASFCGRALAPFTKGGMANGYRLRGEDVIRSGGSRAGDACAWRSTRP